MSFKSHVKRNFEIRAERTAGLKLLKHVDEQPLFIIPGAHGSLVAFENRCMILKPGVFAGSLGGGRASTFYYRDITGIEINTGMLMGVLEIMTASYQGTANRDYWSTGRNRSSFKVSNCLPIAKPILKEHAANLSRLQQMIGASK
jgi:hypothetical protein